jgi:hypothetical protein
MAHKPYAPSLAGPASPAGQRGQVDRADCRIGKYDENDRQCHHRRSSLLVQRTTGGPGWVRLECVRIDGITASDLPRNHVLEA